MLKHDIEWEKKGTHEKHLSVLDFEKQERQKEVAELEQTISGSKEELSDILHQQIAAGQETEQIKENNNTIRNLTREYKKIEPDCWEGVRAQLERMKELCKERNNLYEKQNDLKGQKYKIEKSLER